MKKLVSQQRKLWTELQVAEYSSQRANMENELAQIHADKKAEEAGSPSSSNSTAAASPVDAKVGCYIFFVFFTGVFLTGVVLCFAEACQDEG